MYIRTLALSLFLAFTINAAFAATPIPSRVLSAEEKAADMVWLYSIMGDRYAPMELKEKLYGFDFEALKKKYLKLAKSTKTNEEFYYVMERFIAEFKDTHTRLTLTVPPEIPGRAQIAYVGLSGERYHDGMLVTKLMPGVNPESFPVQVGDVITHVDGVPLLKYIDQHVVPYRNLGNPLSNYTYLLPSVFTRISAQLPLPDKTDLSLKIVRPTAEGQQELSVQIPWVVKDFFDFKKDQERIAAMSAGVRKLKGKAKEKVVTGQLVFTDQAGGIHDLDTAFTDPDHLDRDFYNSFQHREIVDWEVVEEGAKKGEVNPYKLPPMQRLAKERSIPHGAIAVPEATVYPAYVASFMTLDKNKKPHGKQLFGYIRLDTFSPEMSNNPIKDMVQAVASLKATLKKFSDLGVRKVVVDTMGNPGGNVLLLMEVAQAFSNRPIHWPLMQFGVNESWVDKMLIRSSHTEFGESEREIFRRVLVDLQRARAEGQRLSKPFSMDTFAPFAVKPNMELGRPFEMVVLVDEGNASCGDIFPQIMQENKMAMIVGTRTMGAGGNVVGYDGAPSSGAAVSMTESLMLKADGTYLENRGVIPDIPIDFRARQIFTPKREATLNVALSVLNEARLIRKQMEQARQKLAQKAAEKSATEVGTVDPDASPHEIGLAKIGPCDDLLIP